SISTDLAWNLVFHLSQLLAEVREPPARPHVSLFRVGWALTGVDREHLRPPATASPERASRGKARTAGRITGFAEALGSRSSVGGWRSLAARTVRDREAPGSNPGPPTTF